MDISKYIEECSGILDTIPDMVLILDKTGKILFVNEAPLRAYGYEKKDVQGINFLELEFIPEDSKRVTADNMIKRMRGETVKPYAVCINASDGTPIYHEINATSVDWQGETIDVVIMRDITERRQAEQMLFDSAERYHDLFEHANDLIQSVDMDGRYIYVNRTWRQTLGYSQQDLDNMTFHDVIAPESMEHCQTIFGQVMAGEDVSNVEATFVTKDKRRIVVQGNVNCAYKDGKPVATRGIFRNVTDQKKAEDELEKARRDFASMIVHDLRSPLTSIKGFTDLMAAERLGPISEGQIKALKIIKEAVDKQLSLINDYLDVSKLESGQMEVDLQAVDIRQPIRKAMRLVEVQAGLKNINLTPNIESGLPQVLGAEEKLEQVLLNLLANAVKFTGEGGSIVVSASRAQESDMVQVSVSDTGTGIPADEMPHLFQKYRQLVAAKSNGEKGTGLGLVIARLIVVAHGGRIWAESEINKGSTFHFTVPAAG